MIYVDTSVALAHLLAEDLQPPSVIWSEFLVASRLIEYEIWTRLHARGLAVTHGEAADAIISRIALVELAPPVLERALDPFPLPVRTLDALHLATCDFLRSRGQRVELATYDHRMVAVARAMAIRLVDLDA